MKTLGIDYGVRKLSVAALTFTGVGAVPEVFSFFWDKKTSRDYIVYDACEKLQEHHLRHLWEDVDLVNIEYPFFINSRQTAIRMSMMAGALMVQARKLTNNTAQVRFVEPAKWKREVVGYARADKTQTMEYLNAEWPDFTFHNDDEADALCLALHGYLENEPTSGKS